MAVTSTQQNAAPRSRSFFGAVKKYFESGNTEPAESRPLFLYNTLIKAKEQFTLPPHVKAVRMYNCGPTVYGPQHIGNLSMFVFTDILRRVLEYNDFPVKQVINFTDFGHLTSDADEGEDKMTKGLKREGLAPTMENMRALGEKYAERFLEDIRLLNIDTERIAFPRASDYVPAQIALIATLEEKAYAYRGKEGVYFDTARFPDYGKLGGIDLAGLKEGARVAVSDEKKHPTDFLLWKSSKKTGWDSPWGKGFPGWHIECSAMIRSTLGEQIDIHTGGIEHIPIHHNNEIAQSESATGKKPLSRFWLHRAHIQIEGSKIAKSDGNTIYLSDVVERGYHPLSLRYLFLGAHYRTSANFSWAGLDAAQTAFLKLRSFVDANDVGGSVPRMYQKRWHERFNDDLDTPGALAAVWEMIGDPDLSPNDKRAGIIDADRVFGLSLGEQDEEAEAVLEKKMGRVIAVDQLPAAIREIVEKRENARASKDWARADALRDKLHDEGYEIKDTDDGPQVVQH